MAQIAASRRVRRTAFTDGVEAAGVRGYTVYNHMLLATVFASVEEDCRHLKSAVQLWDVACERQVEIAGPDAARLMALLTPRDLSRIVVGQCGYVPVCDAGGGMLNDPVLVKLAEDRFWLSLADTDLLLWIKGLSTALCMDVTVFEPDVSPLAIQGPKAGIVAERLFGPQVHEIGFFRFAPVDFGGRSHVLARSGWSKQGGFELYLDGSDLGMDLWQAAMRAGADLDIRAGCPNLIERIEGGLLSFGNDMTYGNTPFECGLGRFVTSQTDYIGRAALEAQRRQGHDREVQPVEIAGPRVPPCDRPWPLTRDGAFAGQVTSAIWSPDFATNVAIAMVERSCWAPGTELVVETPDGPRDAVVKDRFWN